MQVRCGAMRNMQDYYYRGANGWDVLSTVLRTVLLDSSTVLIELLLGLTSIVLLSCMCRFY